MIIEAAKALAQAIQDSEEFVTYKRLDQELDQEPEIKTQIEDFQKRQFALQRAHLTGMKLDEKELSALDALFKSLVQHEKVAQYFEAELKINQAMTEVSRILGDAMNLRQNQ